MMFIRHLAVLGALFALFALALASPKKSKGKSTKSKCESKEGGTIAVGPLYDEGCPCFNQEDVDAFLALATGSDYCSYTEYIDFVYGAHEWDISASTPEESYFAGVADFINDTDICASDSFIPNSGSSFAYVDKYAFAYLDGTFAGTTSDCQALIEAVKDKVASLGCDVSIYYNCGCWNGECTPDGSCICNPGWTGTYCDTCVDGYVGPNCDYYLPGCDVPYPQWIGNGYCDGEPYNSEECELDGGDCCASGYFGTNCDLYLPDCNATVPQWVGDGYCDYGDFNTEECEWDGGDCCGVNGYECQNPNAGPNAMDLPVRPIGTSPNTTKPMTPEAIPKDKPSPAQNETPLLRLVESHTVTSFAVLFE